MWKKNITLKEVEEIGRQVFSQEDEVRFKKIEKQLVQELKGDNLTLVLRKDKE